jgi:hypothetical protein
LSAIPVFVPAVPQSFMPPGVAYTKEFMSVKKAIDKGHPEVDVAK